MVSKQSNTKHVTQMSKDYRLPRFVVFLNCGTLYNKEFLFTHILVVFSFIVTCEIKNK